GLLRLGALHLDDHLFGRLAADARDVVEAVARIGQARHRALDRAVEPELAQPLVDGPGQGPDRPVHFRGIAVEPGFLLFAHGVPQAAAIFSRILATFSSSVALVKGLTM